MSSKKKFFIICGILAGAGVIVSLAGYAMGSGVTGVGLDSHGIHVYRLQDTVKEKEYQQGNETTDAFSSISVQLEYADAGVELSDHYGVEYRIDSEYQFSYKVEDGCLKIIQRSKNAFLGGNFNWFLFGVNGNFMNQESKREYVKIYVPKHAQLKEASVKTESGSIQWTGINAENMNIKSEYGNVFVEDAESTDQEISLESGSLDMNSVTCEELQVKSEYGDTGFREVKVKNRMEVGLESGKLELQKINAGSLICSSEYGDVKGGEVTADQMEFKLESGDFKVSSLEVKDIWIKSEYGDVNLNPAGKFSAYEYNLYTDYGSVEIEGEDMGDTYRAKSEGGKSMEITCESGDIIIE